MKLIIDIDEDVYKKIVADKYAIYDKMFYSIKNGTPMPDNATVCDIEQIRAEIADLEEGISSYHNDRPWVFKDEVLEIIDKYTEGR